jgi:2-oxoglutarate ferredoxin oxidoreductase subunit gamma
MRHDLFISGFGGQGVLLAGNLLSYAAIMEGKNVSFLPSYGVEKKGGAVMCTVVIADGEVGSPVVGSPAVTIFLNQASLDKFGARTRAGGTCIINTSLVDTAKYDRTDIRIIRLPMNEIAMELGDSLMVNMVAVGAYCRLTRAVSLSSLADALKEVLPERNHSFIPANLAAIEVGASRSAYEKT